MANSSTFGDFPKSTSLKRRTLTVVEKIHVIEMVEKGTMKKSEIARKFGIPSNTLSTILKHKDTFKKKWIGNSDRKRFREGSHPDLETKLFKWYEEAKIKNLPISGPIMREKASEIAKQMKKSNFQPSNGWFHRFKERHGVILNKRSKPAAANESQTLIDNQDPDGEMQSWLLSTKTLISGYSPCDVYNAEAADMFYQVLPQKASATREELNSSGLNNRIPLTVLVCTNMDASDKRKLLVVGESPKPDLDQLPEDYRVEKNCRITQEIFKEWIRTFEEDMVQQDRKIVLIIDNCLDFVTNDNLMAIDLQPIPSSANKNILPMNDGIIKTMKGIYRKLIFQKVQNDLEEGSLKIFDIGTVCNLLDASWRAVSRRIIGNCWKYSAVGKIDLDVSLMHDDDTDNLFQGLDIKSECQDDGFSLPLEICCKLEPMEDLDQIPELELHEPNLSETANRVSSYRKSCDKTLSDICAFESVDTLRTYFAEKNLPTVALDEVENLLTFAVIGNRKQTTLDDYFEKL